MHSCKKTILKLHASSCFLAMHFHCNVFIKPFNIISCDILKYMKSPYEDSYQYIKSQACTRPLKISDQFTFEKLRTILHKVSPKTSLFQ